MVKNENKIPGFRNYNDWKVGYDMFLEFFRDGIRYIKYGEEACKYHSDNETIEEMQDKLSKLVDKLVEGATSLQYIKKSDFYYQDEDIEILIRFKNQDYKDVLLNKRPNKLLQDVIKLLNTEKKQFMRIVKAYDTTD